MTGAPSAAPDARTAELADRLDRVEARIAAACAAAGRPRAALRLVVVTKTYPVTDVAALAGLGVADVGESRHPEAGRKVDEYNELAEVGQPALCWHFVGAVQTNKAAAVARYADLVHSVDRTRLVAALDRGAEGAGRLLDCLVQVDLDPAAGMGTRTRGRHGPRSGVAPAGVEAVADAVAAAGCLRLRGVMAVAPLGGDPAEAFDRLASVAARLSSAHPAVDVVSAGMSDDLEQAVRAGATLLRVGRAILGERPPLR